MGNNIGGRFAGSMGCKSGLFIKFDTDGKKPAVGGIWNADANCVNGENVALFNVFLMEEWSSAGIKGIAFWCFRASLRFDL